MDEWIKKLWDKRTHRHKHTYIHDGMLFSQRRAKSSLVTIWLEHEALFWVEIRQRKTDIYNATYIQTLKGETETRFVVPGAE